MSKYLTIVFRLADNADQKLVFDQMDRISGATLSAAAWSHVMDGRDALEAENKRLREALRWRIKWEQSVIDQCPTLGFLELGGAYCRGLRIVAESKERAALAHKEAR